MHKKYMDPLDTPFAETNVINEDSIPARLNGYGRDMIEKF